MRGRDHAGLVKTHGYGTSVACSTVPEWVKAASELLRWLSEFPRLSLARVNEELVKALVVDSSNTMRSVLLRILSMRGFEVAGVDDCGQAIEALHGMGTADLVLLDWSLDETDTLAFLARLRLEAEHDTMVIMLASTEPGVRSLQRALIAGADDYLMKPFTSLQIDEKLEQVGHSWR